MAYAFVNFIEKESCTKFCGILVRFHEIIKLQSFEFSLSDVIPANIQNISSLVFFAFFFFTNLWSCEVFNVKPYLNVRETIHTNEQTKHANCGLHGLRGFMSFCFKTKKDHFKQKLLLWPQVPFKGFNLCRPSVPSPYYSLMPPVSTTFLQLKIRKIIFWRPPIIKIAFSWLWWRRWNWMQFVCNCIIKSPELSDIFKNYK